MPNFGIKKIDYVIIIVSSGITSAFALNIAIYPTIWPIVTCHLGLLEYYSYIHTTDRYTVCKMFKSRLFSAGIICFSTTNHNEMDLLWF